MDKTKPDARREQPGPRPGETRRPPADLAPLPEDASRVSGGGTTVKGSKSNTSE
jgi:hypothetical protein